MTQVALPVSDALDPDDLDYSDENGRIESMTDPDTGEKITADPAPEPERAPRGPSDINPDNDNDTAPDPAERPQGQRPAAPSQAEQDFLTDALAVYGLESDEIEWNGEQVRVGELSPEDRREFLQELRDRDRAEAAGLNEAELELLDFVRSGGNLAEVFGNQASGSAASQVAGLDADALNRLDIRQQNPELTDEEVASELEYRKGSSLYQKTTDALRSRLTEAETQEQQRVAQQEFAAEREQFVVAAKEIKEIAGFPVNAELNQWLLQQTATQEANGNSPFLNSLSDPKKVLRLQFLDAFAEQMQAHNEQQVQAAYKRGRADALGGAPSRPSGRSGSAGSSGRPARDTSNDADYVLGQD